MIATLWKHYAIDLYFKDIVLGVLQEHSFLNKAIYTYMFFYLNKESFHNICLLFVTKHTSMTYF